MNKKNFKRVLILGHSGFIGSHLAGYFRGMLPGVEVTGYSYPELDLTDEKQASALSDYFDLDTLVIMCSGLKRQFGDDQRSFLQNINMALNVAGLLERHPVKRFIFFSSAAVYGEDVHNDNITEDTAVAPTSFYGIAKHASERIFRKAITQSKESSLLILRPPVIYGPGDSGNTYGPVKFIRSALNKEEITLWGDGGELREFVFIEDIVRVVYALSFHDYEGVINAACAKSHSFRDIIDIVSRVTGDKLAVNSRPRTKNKVDNIFCNKKLSVLLKDFCFTDLGEGIRLTFESEKKTCGVA